MNSKRIFLQITFSVIFLSSVLPVGCSSKVDPFVETRQEVAGFVTLDGEPLKQGRIRFVPVEGTPGPKTSVKIENGTFLIESRHGPVAGTHRIEFESTDDGGYARDDETALKHLKENHIKKIDVILVPKKYGASSPLKAVVKENGPNEFEFQLES
ncbi:MAG TPA: hypothetical protein DIW81_29740 [Planctomycetaceae bacterium]|nr:hypothetical protein [Rubinisphaera sp.]HCS55723.1 hypothetical protein [Planctomycetaceae bacterium]